MNEIEQVLYYFRFCLEQFHLRADIEGLNDETTIRELQGLQRLLGILESASSLPRVLLAMSLPEADGPVVNDGIQNFLRIRER